MMKLKPWILAARPKTLWASVAPVSIGTAIAYGDGGAHAPSAACALLSALLIQIGTNYCNDYADFARGTDNAERTGPVRATAAGWVTPRAMFRATVAMFALAALAALYLIYRGGWPLLVVGALSIASGVLYTEGPRPLAYVGLGDLFTLVFFGPVAVAGTYFVQALSWSWTPVVAGLGPGLLSVAILTANNLRDREGDARSGKRTLAVRFGDGFARWEYVGCVLGAALVPFALVRFFDAPRGACAAAIVLVGALPAFRTLARGTKGAALNHLLAYTGVLLLVYAIVFAVGWVL
ncbi:MAG: 1,4-dihydroxy-2-naphthoate polyprenyltransferase [Kiritimatiellae bacterium]|nr:1,4-dihydroxy-2-naphthoate polyprenyltransferase [Kiritimatiellia bacterium]MCO5062073.1 1,4-dihydroxy-2-naphthoate polyprenyltransferase [Kiritimatiellia bacterium]MCO6399787.1 1,4-dihydroxy-2-naphthoate polyprenyltransferase [Verrucomicrobiota bacterium]